MLQHSRRPPRQSGQEKARELLARELGHRVKNILAVVEALAAQTTGETVNEFRDKFSGRLHALAETHSLLPDSGWRDLDLKSLLQQAKVKEHTP
jgi:two-component sensor histidine kinase